MARTGRPSSWTPEQLAFLEAKAHCLGVGYIAQQVGKTESCVRYTCKTRGLPIVPTRRLIWPPEEVERLKKLVKYHTTSELAEMFDRTEHAIRVKAHKLGLSVNQTNRSEWTKEEVNFLFIATDRMSLKEAGKKLGRTKQSVAAKVRKMGISWVQGRRSIKEVAKYLGVHPNTVRNIAARLNLDLNVPRGGGAANISDQTYDAIVGYWEERKVERKS